MTFPSLLKYLSLFYLFYETFFQITVYCFDREQKPKILEENQEPSFQAPSKE